MNPSKVDAAVVPDYRGLDRRRTASSHGFHARAVGANSITFLEFLEAILPNELGRGLVEHPPLHSVCHDDPVIPADQSDPKVNVLHQRTIAFLALPQRLFCLLALGF